MKIIARIQSDFKDKFGIPRQSGLVNELTAKIVFEPEYRNIDAFKGLSGFNYIWLIWEFSETITDTFKASVRLISVEETENGPVLTVGGADLLDGTPIYDIKPYLPYADCHTDALSGYTEITKVHKLQVEADNLELDKVSEDKREALINVLAEDPRPSYQNSDEARVYGLRFASYEVKFKVIGDKLRILKITTAVE